MPSNGTLPINVMITTNYSLGNPGNITTKFSLPEKIIIGLLLCTLIIIAIGGNVLVCAAVLTDRRLKRNCNFFIVSLAIADLLVAVSVMTFAVPNDVQGTWIFGSEFCNVWISADIMCSTASILNLCVISLDRYIHIKDPLHYEAWMTGKKTVCFIATVWALSLLISFVPIYLGWQYTSDVRNIYGSNSCVFELNPVYAVLSSTVSFYVPCVVMISIYCRLYSCAKRHAEIIRKTHTGDRFHIQGKTEEHIRKGGGYRGSEHKAAVTLGIIMGVFLLCWVPFFIMNPINAFCPSCIPEIVYKILTWFGYANSCLNPIIYSIFNQEFRDVFRKILFPKCIFDQNITGEVIQDHKMKKNVYASPVSENGKQQNYGRKNSREQLFSDRITAL